MSGGYDYEVVGEVLEDLVCSICLNLIKDAMQLQCGHGMCKSCLDDLELNSRERGFDFICPSCRQDIENENVHPAKMINRIVLSVKVKCVNLKKGCVWIGDLGNAEDHLQKSCNFELVICTFERCKEKVERQQLEQHQQCCPHRTVFCQYCMWECKYSDLQEHLQLCEKFPVLCPNGCYDGSFIPRGKIQDHRAACEKEIIPCEFSSFGCDFMSPRGKALDHVGVACQYHLTLAMFEIKKMKTQIDTLTSNQAERLVTETGWYTEKLHSMILDTLKTKNEEHIKKYSEQLLEELKDTIDEFDKKLWLFSKGLLWLVSEFEEVCRRSFLPNTNLKRVITMAGICETSVECVAVMKKEICLPESTWVEIEFAIEKEYFEIYKKVHSVKDQDSIQQVLSYGARFQAVMKSLRFFTTHEDENINFSKIKLRSTGRNTMRYGLIAFAGNTVTICPHLMGGPCFIYNHFEEKKAEIHPSDDLNYRLAVDIFQKENFIVDNVMFISIE